MDKITELLPCPFCGSEEIYSERADYSACYIFCNNCGTRGATSCNEIEEDVAAEEAGMEPGENAARRLWNTRHNDAQMAAPDALAKVRAALGQYQEAPFRSADWLANRLMDIFNADGMKGEGPCLGTTKQTSDTHKGLAEKLKAVGDADLTSGAFRLAKDNLTDFVIRNSEAILTSLSASNAPFDASEQRVDDHQTGLSLKGGQQAHDSNAMREALTPSGDTKAAYMGEFSFTLTRIDECGDEYPERVYVPWTTIKEIMAAILKRAEAPAALANTPKLDPVTVDDTKRLDHLRDASWDLRCFSVPTGGDDADIGWRVIGHWMAEPQERMIAEVFTDDPRQAIDEAIRALKDKA